MRELIEQANWLPAPDGGFYLNLRLFGPDDSFEERNWVPPQVKVVQPSEGRTLSPGQKQRGSMFALQTRIRGSGLIWVKGGHEMDAVGQPLTRPLYLRELTDLMQRGRVPGSAIERNIALSSRGYVSFFVFVPPSFCSIWTPHPFVPTLSASASASAQDLSRTARQRRRKGLVLD